LLPEFNQNGDLPPGVYPIDLDEAIRRFGNGNPQRQAVTDRLRRIYDLAQRTGAVQRFLVFGSSVTDKPALTVPLSTWSGILTNRSADTTPARIPTSNGSQRLLGE
jgi:hypothetical protein